MNTRHHSAVIFDVDGPLLDLTPAEEDAVFVPFSELYGLRDQSRDWDSYRVRNDVEIFREILERHLNRMPTDDELNAAARRYFEVLSGSIEDGAATVTEIPGAGTLLHRLDDHGGIALGTATANFRQAARIRLERVGMWEFVKAYPGAADDGGPKRDVLAKVVGDLGLPKERIVFLGDNLNDLDAGQACGVHFIGFHTDPVRQKRLADAGASVTCGDHETSWTLIAGMLDLAGA